MVLNRVFRNEGIPGSNPGVGSKICRKNIGSLFFNVTAGRSVSALTVGQGARAGLAGELAPGFVGGRSADAVAQVVAVLVGVAVG
jgi:uncharacterized protein YdbL (DUF1318 family)